MVRFYMVFLSIFETLNDKLVPINFLTNTCYDDKIVIREFKKLILIVKKIKTEDLIKCEYYL